MRKIELDIVALSHSVTQSHNYAVVLGEKKGARRLPIVIGSFEAQAIAVAMERMTPNRPLTHDLLVQILGQLETTLTRIVVTEVREHIFFAELHLVTGGRDLVVSCRPSDAIAIAVRTGSPIFATEGLLLQAGQHPVEIAEENDEEAIIDEFRDFLDDLDPDDFKGD